MKRKLLGILLVLCVFITGCAKNETKDKINSNEVNKSENKETIYASFYPIYNLTKQIAGDKYNVESFTNLNTEVHDFEPSAKEMAKLSGAKLLILNGAGLESWADSVRNSVDVEILDSSKGVDLIKSEEDDHHHEDKHDNHEDEDKHDHHEEGDHHEHGLYDPHIWLSPKNVIIQANNIANKLGEIDSTNKEYYQENFEKIKKELEEIDSKYSDLLKNKKNRKILVDHEAFSYLARDYNLEQIALTSITSTNETDANTMKKAIDYIKDNNISVVFYEKGGSDKNVKTLADELSIDIKPINTIEYANDEDLKENKTLQELLKENLELIESSLE
ncbi:zinc ABC transporter substrate-binding protein [Anaerococcus sp. AGMB00486]|uniref:Zinc ABC transporter substrate-binding protein n=2 Tax=Anaerococcus TaxID=165779 RepID=A0ABX2N897_9FIRM|nr:MULTISPECIES: zinc ABC transporter substrate-binding protein [Anaerococcus]MSS77285.1 zinc ABC transporter substrate-binding protein [Anaerococcus porci]NVF10912.1 zinc ABC transporter substrate-binding protein [Anaerococcus faecalis]